MFSSVTLQNAVYGPACFSPANVALMDPDDLNSVDEDDNLMPPAIRYHQSQLDKKFE